MEWTAAGVIVVGLVLIVRGWRRHHQRWSVTFHIDYDDQKSGREKAPPPPPEDGDDGA